MPYGLYVSAEGANVQSRRMETLANNLANVDTTAFKRDEPIFQARLAEATARGLDQPGSRTINDLSGGVRFLENRTDFSQGVPKQTGTATDLAINGDGFFVVQKGNQRMLTRAGNFMFDPNGKLVTENGYTVLNDAGLPVQIDTTLPWQFTPDAGLTQAGETALLGMVRPKSLGDLVKVGENLFAPLAPTAPVAPELRSVASGFLEASGVKPAIEMVELIETSRAFEANVTLIRNQDQMLGNLISHVLKDTTA